MAKEEKFKMVVQGKRLQMARGTIEHPELEGGRYWTPVPWSMWKGTGWRRGRSTGCYRTAVMFAIDHPEVKYVEGFAWADKVVYAHAWNVDVEGRVIERTWRVPNHLVKVLTYYGAVVEKREVAQRLLEQGRKFGPILPIVAEFQTAAEEKESRGGKG